MDRFSRFFGRAAIVSVVLATPASAAAYCRTRTHAVPEDYDAAANGCFTEGRLLFWRNACVGYTIQQAASRRIGLDDATRVIDASFAAWMSVKCPASNRPAGISFSNLGAVECDEVRYNEKSGNQNVIVFRDESWPYRDAYNTLALTTVTFDAQSGEIYDADIEINTSGLTLMSSEQVPDTAYDLASVVTHEAGHFLGLAHATDAESTMFATYEPGSSKLRSLAADDIAGLCAIYPDGTSRVASPQPRPTCTWCAPPSPSDIEIVPADVCDPTPRHGFTSACTTPPPPLPPSGSGGGCAIGGATTPDPPALTVALMGGVLLRRRPGRGPRTDRGRAAKANSF